MTKERVKESNVTRSTHASRKMDCPMEVPMTKASATEISTTRFEEKGDTIGLSAPLSFTPAKFLRGVGIKEALSPIDKDDDWVIAEGAIDPVSQLALSNCQHKLRDDEHIVNGVCTGQFANSVSRSHCPSSSGTRPVVVVETRGLGRNASGSTETVLS
jgi:hypothetical protein